MKISTPFITSQTIHLPITNKNETDVVHFMTPPSIQLSTICKTLLLYSKDCTFCFEGYNGIDDENRLMLMTSLPDVPFADTFFFCQALN